MIKSFAIWHVSDVHCICPTSVTFVRDDCQLCECRLNQKLRVSTTRVSRQSVPPFLMTSTSDRTEKQIRKECLVICLQHRTTKSTATSSLYCYNVHSRKAGTWQTAMCRTPPLCYAYRVVKHVKVGQTLKTPVSAYFRFLIDLVSSLQRTVQHILHNSI